MYIDRFLDLVFFSPPLTFPLEITLFHKPRLHETKLKDQFTPVS